MTRVWTITLLVTLVCLAFSTPTPALAQQPVAPELAFFTTYPSQVIGIGETVSLDLKLRAGTFPQLVHLDMKQIPDGWTVSFRGRGRDIKAVYVEAGSEASVDLKIEPPSGVEAGTYRFVAAAQGESVKAELPIELTVKEKAPTRLSLGVELPTLRGTSKATFRYDVTLKNEGDEDLTVNLSADTPPGFLATFQLTGKEVTNLPLEANGSKQLSVEVEPLAEVPAGSYPIAVRAQGGSAETSLELVAEVIGRSELSITAPDGRLSGQAYAGEETPLKIVVHNTGTAPARQVELSSSEPSGWSVEFDPKQVAEIPAGEQVDVTARLRPADKAVAGDYMITIRARPADGTNESAEFRITVLTSTLWGVVGIGLIAVAVGVVALAVMRFGRR